MDETEMEVVIGCDGERRCTWEVRHLVNEHAVQHGDDTVDVGDGAQSVGWSVFRDIRDCVTEKFSGRMAEFELPRVLSPGHHPKVKV